jgi:hypothetical protein
MGRAQKLPAWRTFTSSAKRFPGNRKYSYRTSSTVYLRQSKGRLCYFYKSNRGLRCPGEVKMWLSTTVNRKPQPLNNVS